jgi:hypothetical protein
MDINTTQSWLNIIWRLRRAQKMKAALGGASLILDYK